MATDDTFFPYNTDITIDKVQLTPEVIDDFRLNFKEEASAALAKDLVETFSIDYAKQIEEDPEFFSYDLLKSGKAKFFDRLSPEYTMNVNGKQKPIRDMLPAERAVRFQNDDAISALFTNADIGSLPRAYFGELFKTAPSVYAGTKAAQAVAARTFATPPVTPQQFVLKSVPPILAYLGGSYLLYEGADALEEGLLGPDEVILPGQKPIIEAVRTAGGATAGIQFPFLMKERTSRAARDFIKNLADDAPAPTATRMTAALENMIEGMAKGSKGKTGAALTVLGETVAGTGSTLGAYFVEEMYPGQTMPRLGAEFLGGNTFAATLMKLLPAAVMKTRQGISKFTKKEVPVEEGDDVLQNLANTKQQKLFKRMNELYTLHEGNYEAMMQDLNNEETNKILAEVFPEINFTAAQRLSDDTGLIMGVESAMAKENPELMAARIKADKNAREFFNKWIAGLTSTGSKEDLKAAGILRQNLFSDQLKRRLTAAVDKRLSASQQLLKGVGEYPGYSQQELSIELGNTLEAQIKLARDKENTLWKQFTKFNVYEPQEVLDNDVTPVIITKYDELLDDLLPAYRKAFISKHAELHETIQSMKRSLGIDIREGLKEQASILEDISNRQPEILSKMNLYFTNTYGPAVQSTKQRLAAQNMLVKQIQDGALGEDKLTKAERKVMLSAAKAQAKTLELELAKQDPTRLEGVSAHDLWKLRRELRNEAVSFYSGATTKMGSADEARKFGQLSDSILEDFDTVEDGVNDAYDIARSYSTSLNDVFTRSLVGKARAMNAMGGNRIPPELLVQTFLKNTPDVTDLRIKELQGVAKFAHDQGFEGATETFTTIDNIIESALRNARSKVVYPTGHAKEGQVDANALALWKRDNAELLERFPNLNRDLESAIAAQRTFEVFADRAAKGKKLISDQTYLADLIGGSPTEAVSDALNFTPKLGNAKNPVQGLTRLFRLNRLKFKDADGNILPEAQQAAMRAKVNKGLEESILQYAFMSAGGEGQTFDPKTFHQVLFGPLNPKTPGIKGERSLMELATRYGVVDEKLSTKIKTISTQMLRLAAADAAGKLDDPALMEQVGPLFEFYIGTVGLAGGTKAYQALVGKNAGTGSISAAQQGKQWVLRMFRDLPASQRLSMFQMVFTDPETVATLLQKPTNQKDAVRQLNRLQQIFVNKGFSATAGEAPYIIREMYEDQDRGTGATLEEMTGTTPDQQSNLKKEEPQASLNRTPAAPTVAGAAAPRPAPFVVAQAPVASAPPVQQARPADRSRFAAAFPSDITAPFIKQQGIETLLG